MRIHSLFQKAIGALLFSVWMGGASMYTVHAQESDTVVDDTISTSETVVDEALPPYVVTPVVANEKAKPRDIIKKELVVTNNTAQRVDLYLTVEDIDPTDGAQAYAGISDSDRSTSLASWVEITRGVIELSPGESRKVPYLVHVNLTARPGSYFAHIRAREGSTRQQAEARSDGATLILNLEVMDDAKERLQLGTFSTNDSVTFGNSVSFSYLLENIGNRDVEPRGSIRIFNRRGEEVGSVPLNADGIEISPENKEQLASVWSSAGRFGKYKAFLDLEYGENQLASVQDTVYFWVFPWKEILASLFGVLVLAIVGTFIIHMRAVARPRPAYERYVAPTPVANDMSASRAPTYGGRASLQDIPPRPIAIPRAPGAQRQAQARETHIRARQGNTVSLARRGQQGASTMGNTVTLPPRR